MLIKILRFLNSIHFLFFIPSFVVTLFLISFYFYLNNFIYNILLHNSKNMLKTNVQLAISILHYYNEKVYKGEMSLEDAKLYAKNTIKMLRYGPHLEDYFWINTDDPKDVKMVMHPYRNDLDGKSLTDFKDVKGKLLFVEMAKICEKNKSGFIEYWWQYKNQKDNILEKISYVESFGPWGWIVGTGLYKVDLQESFLAYFKRIDNLILVCIVSLILLLNVGGFLAYKNIKSKLDKIIFKIKDISYGKADLTKLLDFKKIVCNKNIKCGNPNCKSYNKEGYCWIESGSYSVNISCAKVSNKEIEKCDECVVYKKAIKNEIDEIIAFINAIIYRIKTLVQDTKNISNLVLIEADSIKNVSIKSIWDNATSLYESNVEINNLINNAKQHTDVFASSIEELNVSISEIVKNIDEMSNKSDVLKNNALKIKDSIDLLISAISNISKISKTITEIASQTNLLALNATIEAARAGELGKGFVVVANEIKELAKRTANEVNEINNIIEEINKYSESVIKDNLEVTAKVMEMADYTSSISATTQQQSSVIQHLSKTAIIINDEISVINEKKDIISKYVTNIKDELILTFENTEKMYNSTKRLNEQLDNFVV